jgi:8-oxo-dGTP pyrophosphatase MutT (NUDIX family)
MSSKASSATGTGASGIHASGEGSGNGGDVADRASVLDRSFQLAYKVAYRMMRFYWGVRRPATHGALVTLWNDGELLLIQNSYVRYRSLPGGYVGRFETGPEAAVRELREEIGVKAHPDQLEKLYDEVKDWEGKRDHVEVFKLTLDNRPRVRIDHREVIDAGWYSPEKALELDLFPPIRLILEGMLRQRALSQNGQSASTETPRRSQ